MTGTVDPLAWQIECTSALRSAAAVGGLPGRTQWLSFREAAVADRKKIVIADADFSNTGLEAFDLSRCWIGRTLFTNANLTGATFAQSIFRDCDATGANIEAANFRNADMRGSGLILEDVQFDADTIFETGATLLPDALDPGLRVIAERSRRERLWRSRQSRSWLVRLMLWLTDYGFAFRRLVGGGVAIMAAFAIGFRAVGKGWIDSILGSVDYFLSLNDSFAEPAFRAAGAVEALIGMLFFAVLTSIFVSLFFDRA